MKYTTQQLQVMNDFQRNHAIALKLYPNATVVPSWPGCSSVTIVTGEFTKIMVDYCNNPNDIMPLAFECGISITQTYTDRENGVWNAALWRPDVDDQFTDTNPLRAIACRLLMMD